MYAFRNTRVAFPALEADVVCSGRAVSENSCIRDRCLFGEGGHRELVLLVIRGECLTRDGSTAYDLSLAFVSLSALKA